jgi:hypothetical protein
MSEWNLRTFLLLFFTDLHKISPRAKEQIKLFASNFYFILSLLLASIMYLSVFCCLFTFKYSHSDILVSFFFINLRQKKN